MSKAKVALVAVNYFSARDLPALVRSAQAQTHVNWVLYVIDNSASPAEAEALKAYADEMADSRLQVLSSEKNLGYLNALAWLNQRRDLAAYQWVGLMNMDIEFEAKNSLESLCATPQATVGVVAPSIVSGLTGRDQNPFMRERPAMRTMLRRRVQFFHWRAVRCVVWAKSRAAKELGKRTTAPAHLGEATIYAPHGACFFLSQEYVRRGGALKHPVLLFNEELTVAEECRTLGLTVLYQPSVRMTHREHASTGELRAAGLWRSKAVAKAQADAARYGYRLIRRNNRRALQS